MVAQTVQMLAAHLVPMLDELTAAMTVLRMVDQSVAPREIQLDLWKAEHLVVQSAAQ